MGSADIGPYDVDVAQLYDAFTPLIPLSLEGYGFCGRGEGGAFTDDGAIELGGGPAGQHQRRRPVRGLRARLQPDRRGGAQMRGSRPTRCRSRDLPGHRGEGVPTSALLLRS